MAKHRPRYQEIDGIKIPPFFSKDLFESALQFQPKAGDIFIATYPKCGTTWMQNVVVNILRRGQPLDNPCDFFLASPFLDQLGAEESEQRMIRPGAYKTHLPLEKVPWSDTAKYIYVARNPKDCCVSFYHHMRQFPGYQYSEATFNEFFELFINGDVEYNDYFAHLLSWYNIREKPNVFVTTYEEMKENLENVVMKVAEFINKGEAKHLEDHPEVLREILHRCSFEEMKFINDALTHLYNNVENVLADPKMTKGRKHIAAYIAQFCNGTGEYISFIRKGETGGWKAVFTPEQDTRMKEKIKVVTKCSEVMSLWKNVT